MLPIEWIQALILGLVEGATEFIPVSSTGHLILVGHWLNFVGDRAAVFEVVIQLGAILAVVWQYRALLMRLARDVPRERHAQHMVAALFVAFLPAAAVGLLTHKWITAHLFRPVTVAIALIVGGIFILAVERFRPPPRDHTVEEMSLKTAFGIGVAQILSLFPGFSRSAATIMGGLALGVDRPASTEFSFLLALPIMFAATGLDLVTNRALLSRADIPVFAIGLITAFVSALIVIRILIRFVANHTFKGFAWYRIGLGVVLLVAMQLGVLAL